MKITSLDRKSIKIKLATLEQTKVSLDVWLDSYEDILFQVYTDDYIVELFTRSMMVRMLPITGNCSEKR